MDRTPGWAHERYGLSRGRETMFAGAQPSPGAAANAAMRERQTESTSMFDGIKDAAGAVFNYPGVFRHEEAGLPSWSEIGNRVWNFRGVGREPSSQNPGITTAGAVSGPQANLPQSVAPMAGGPSMFQQESAAPPPAALSQREAVPAPRMRPQPQAAAPQQQMSPQPQPVAPPPKQPDQGPTPGQQYVESLKELMKEPPDETPQQKRDRLQRALLMGGLSMMQAASQPGANFGGSLAAGALGGVAEYDRLEDEREADADKRRGRGVKVAEAGYGVHKDDRGFGLDKDKFGLEEEKLSETERSNRAREDYYRKSLTKQPRSTRRDEKALYEEAYDDMHGGPKQGESQAAYRRKRAEWALKQMSQSKTPSDEERLADIEESVRNSPEGIGLSSMEVSRIARERLMAQNRALSGGEGGGAPLAPANPEDRMVGQRYANPQGVVKTWTGSGWQ